MAAITLFILVLGYTVGAMRFLTVHLRTALTQELMQPEEPASFNLEAAEKLLGQKQQHR